jgi:hypothetical protein
MLDFFLLSMPCSVGLRIRHGGYAAQYSRIVAAVNGGTDARLKIGEPGSGYDNRRRRTKAALA